MALTEGHARAWGSGQYWADDLASKDTQSSRAGALGAHHTWVRGEKEAPGDAVTEEQWNGHGEGAASPTTVTTHRAPGDSPPPDGPSPSATLQKAPMAFSTLLTLSPSSGTYHPALTTINSRPHSFHPYVSFTTG